MDGKKLLIGYDLNDTAVQMSVFYQGKVEPATISTVAGEHKYQIPTVLCRARDGRWLYGMEARKAATLHEGTAVDNLVSLAAEGGEAVIDGESYEGTYLLTRFLKETVKLAVKQTGIRDVEAVVFSVPDFSMELHGILKDAGTALGAERKMVFVQNYLESFYYYVANQPKEYWNYQVMLFWFEGEEIKSYELSHEEGRNRKLIRIQEGPACRITKAEDAVPLVTEKEYKEILDKSFLELIKRTFGKKLISAVFLVGDGFDGEWMKESLDFLCRKRRAFQGKNLFTKGACYGARSKAENRNPGGYVYLAREKVEMGIGIKARAGGAEEEVLLIHGGENWYEAEVSCEIIAGEDNELQMFLIRAGSGERREEAVPFGELPDRPAKTLRLLLTLRYESRKVCRLNIKDMGFGPGFPATGYEKEVLLTWEQ